MDEKTAIAQAFKEMAPRYETVMDQEIRRIWGYSYKEFVDELIALVTVNHSDLILDIATGTGVIPIRLSDDFPNGNRIIGLDLTYGMLKQATQSIKDTGNGHNIKLTCASAMEIPFNNESFDLITCGLATHHMSVPKLLNELERILKQGGRITVADVGAAPLWKFFPVKLFVKLFAYLFFLPSEGLIRAWTESTAVSNMYTANDWENALAEAGFSDIKVKKIKSRHFWSPALIAFMAAKQSHTGDTVNADSN